MCTRKHRLDVGCGGVAVDDDRLGARGEQADRGDAAAGVALVGDLPARVGENGVGVTVGPLLEVGLGGLAAALVLAEQVNNHQALGVVILIECGSCLFINLAGPTPRGAGDDQHGHVAEVVQLDRVAVLVFQFELRGDFADLERRALQVVAAGADRPAAGVSIKSVFSKDSRIRLSGLQI